jgi:hypothetical protein
MDLESAGMVVVLEEQGQGPMFGNAEKEETGMKKIRKRSKRWTRALRVRKRVNLGRVWRMI